MIALNIKKECIFFIMMEELVNKNSIENEEIGGIDKYEITFHVIILYGEEF